MLRLPARRRPRARVDRDESENATWAHGNAHRVNEWLRLRPAGRRGRLSQAAVLHSDKGRMHVTAKTIKPTLACRRIAPIRVPHHSAMAVGNPLRYSSGFDERLPRIVINGRNQS